MENRYPLSKFRQRVVAESMNYKVKPEFLFFAKRHHLQTVDADTHEERTVIRTAALRAYKRIKGSRGTIVSIGVKNPEHKE